MTDRPVAHPGAEAHADVRRLLAPSPALGVPIPAYAGRSLPNLSSSVVQALGGERSEAALPPLEPSADPFAGRRADGPVLLLLVDGLGYDRLRLRAERPGGTRAQRWLERTMPLTTVFPTTTTVALASLSTASAPSRHGMVGYRQFLPRYGAVVDMLRLTPLGVATQDSLVGPTWTPSLVVGAPTIFRHGVSGAVAVSRDQFEGKGFTRIIYDGAGFEGYSAWADFAGVLSGVLSRPSPPPLVMAYWDELDTTEHLRGPASAAVDLEIDRLADLLEFVARAVPPEAAARTTVLITADHGLVPTDPRRQVALDEEPALLELMGRPPTGDRRAGLLKARPGAVDRLRTAVEERFPPGTKVIPAEQAVRAGLFGPPPFHEELFERLADLLVLVPSPSGITYAVPGKTPPRRTLVGAHGGLESEELLVPLVAGKLADFGTSE